MGKTGKPCSVQVDGQGLVGQAQGIDTHIELAASEEHRIEEISLADVGFGRVVAIEAFPPRDITDAVEDEDSFPLALACLGRRRRTGFMIHRERESFWVFLNS